MPASSVALDGKAIFVATDVGVFVGAGGGRSWRRYGTGLPNAIAVDVAVDRAGGRLVVTTHGRGVFVAPLEP